MLTEKSTGANSGDGTTVRLYDGVEAERCCGQYVNSGDGTMVRWYDGVEAERCCGR